MTVKTRFDSSFDPPAAVVSIVIRDLGSGKRTEPVRMLLDTGADATLVPASALKQVISDSPLQFVNVTGFDGSRSTFPVYETQLILLGKRFTGRYLAINEGLGILGRDVLNQLHIVLDGPGLALELTHPFQLNK